MRFEGQVGLVTGAASGIGQATAGLLAAEGAFVAVLDVDESGGKQTADAISAAGGKMRGHWRLLSRAVAARWCG